MDAGSGLAGKVALVTGSSRGIGAAIAILFARHGARVAVHGRDAGRLTAVASGIRNGGGTAMTARADVRQFAEIEEMRRRIANAALFLASEQATWITGVILDVSGGGVTS